MTPSELKRKHQDAVPCSHYFDAETMRHFGDTMANYGVRTSGAYWELYRKKPVKDGLQASESSNQSSDKVRQTLQLKPVH